MLNSPVIIAMVFGTIRVKLSPVHQIFVIGDSNALQIKATHLIMTHNLWVINDDQNLYEKSFPLTSKNIDPVPAMKNNKIWNMDKAVFKTRWIKIIFVPPSSRIINPGRENQALYWIITLTINYSLIHRTCDPFEEGESRPVKWPKGRSTNFHSQEKLWLCQSGGHREVYSHWLNNDCRNMKIVRVVIAILISGSFTQVAMNSALKQSLISENPDLLKSFVWQ